MILRISPPAKLNETLKNICLPQTSVNPNQMCVVTGWGRLIENGERATSLREIYVPIIPMHICNNLKHYGGRVHSGSMVCAGYNNGLMDSCQGDSGGPLQCQNPVDGSWELQVSFLIFFSYFNFLFRGLLVGELGVLNPRIPVFMLKFIQWLIG